MAQWALDYHADGRGLGFPFDLAWLDLSARCLHLLAALRTFLRTPPADAQVLKALETLERMLRPLEKRPASFPLASGGSFQTHRSVSPSARCSPARREKPHGEKARSDPSGAPRPEGFAAQEAPRARAGQRHARGHRPDPGTPGSSWPLSLGTCPPPSPAGRRRDSPSGPHEQWLGVSLA